MTKIGIRYTKPRKLIFKALNHFSKPVSAAEINFYLKNKIDLTSIYRTLELMKKINIIEETEFGDGKKRYELMKNNKHHHHLVCENCGDVENIEMKEDNLLDKVKNKSSFLIKEHKLEFFGLCPNCQ
ncbi:transcriptional repressor [Candidatus Roizmanbacteria bacterium]|nr:transcriptional repressor [Candidatus Roizmanbacteria bacterium]